MKYDFDTVIDRRGTCSEKWNVGENELPMWVADMDFQAPLEIREALLRKLDHGVFGYEHLPEEWYDAYIGWWKRRHGLEIGRDWLMFCTGVIPAVSSVIRKLTTPGENVLIQTPVYNCFFRCIQDNGRRILESPLKYEDHAYSMDLKDLEEKMSDPQTTLMLLCNPHNPVGKIWDRETLGEIGRLAKKHHVTILSDEIHCDLTEPGTEYVPFASVSEECREVSITCIAPTKTFNIAGLKTAAVFASDPVLRHKTWRAICTDEVGEPNSFSAAAAVTAFEKGGDWLDELRAYVSENKKLITRLCEEELPEVKVVRGEATYLLWLDISAVSGDSRRLAGFIREKTGLFVTAGVIYGEAGDHFFRMNVACPRSVCEDGFARLKKGIELYKGIR